MASQTAATGRANVFETLTSKPSRVLIAAAQSAGTLVADRDLLAHQPSTAVRAGQPGAVSRWREAVDATVIEDAEPVVPAACRLHRRTAASETPGSAWRGGSGASGAIGCDHLPARRAVYDSPVFVMRERTARLRALSVVIVRYSEAASERHGTHAPGTRPGY